jgi:hypothetical protein
MIFNIEKGHKSKSFFHDCLNVCDNLTVWILSHMAIRMTDNWRNFESQTNDRSIFARFSIQRSQFWIQFARFELAILKRKPKGIQIWEMNWEISQNWEGLRAVQFCESKSKQQICQAHSHNFEKWFGNRQTWRVISPVDETRWDEARRGQVRSNLPFCESFEIEGMINVPISCNVADFHDLSIRILVTVVFST